MYRNLTSTGPYTPKKSRPNDANPLWGFHGTGSERGARVLTPGLAQMCFAQWRAPFIPRAGFNGWHSREDTGRAVLLIQAEVLNVGEQLSVNRGSLWATVERQGGESEQRSEAYCCKAAGAGGPPYCKGHQCSLCRIHLLLTR